MNFRGVVFLALVFSGSLVSAKECKITVLRTPCPGRELEALKPYEGRSETEEITDVSGESACWSLAEKSAQIIRKGVLSFKKVSVSFDGKPAPRSYESQSDCRSAKPSL